MATPEVNGLGHLLWRRREATAAHRALRVWAVAVPNAEQATQRARRFDTQGLGHQLRDARHSASGDRAATGVRHPDVVGLWVPGSGHCKTCTTCRQACRQLLSKPLREDALHTLVDTEHGCGWVASGRLMARAAARLQSYHTGTTSAAFGKSIRHISQQIPTAFPLAYGAALLAYPGWTARARPTTSCPGPRAVSTPRRRR